jgi:hypothetical protein
MADDEINVGRRWNEIALVNILDLYGVEASWQILFVIGHTFTPNIIFNCQMNVATKKNKTRIKLRTKLKRWKVSIDMKQLCKKNKSEVVDQHGHGLHAWQLLWKVLPKEEVHLEGLIKGITKIIEEDEHEIRHLNIHTYALKWWASKRYATFWNFY